MKSVLWVVRVVIGLAVGLGLQTAVRAEAGAYEVETILETWVDAARSGREVPIKAYLPKDAGGASPVVIFSHGLGGTREGYGYLGEYWASHGYVSVHIQHVGSDDTVWRDARPRERMRAMRAATKDLANSLNRPMDVSFVLDELEKLNAEAGSAWHDRLDMKHVGMAGHSYGAYTTTAIAGQVFVGRRGKTFSMGDERVGAAVAMSTQAPRDPDDYDASYAEITVPIFYMTGTHDTTKISPTTVADRRVAFDHTPGPADGGPDVYLLTFTNGDHMIFSGRPRRGFDPPAGGDDAVFQKHIRESTLAFWDAYLRGDQASRDRLRNGAFAEGLGEVGVLEVKP